MRPFFALALLLSLAGGANAADEGTKKLTYDANRTVQTVRFGDEVRTTAIDSFTVVGPESKVQNNDALKQAIATFFRTYGMATEMLLARAGNGPTVLARDFCRVSDDHFLHWRTCNWAERYALDHGTPLPARADSAAFSAKSVMLQK